MKLDNLFLNTVKKNLKVGLIPMLIGEPGIGKSSWVEHLAEEMDTKCFTLACNQLADKADLTGARLMPTDDGEYKQKFYPHMVLHDAITYAEEHTNETPILFLDEINRTTPDVTSAILSIPTARTIGSKSLPTNLKILIAGNDKGNVTSLDKASISRFVPYKILPDLQTYFKANPDLNEYVKETLKKRPDTLLCDSLMSAESNDDEYFDDYEDMSQVTNPRTITGISKFLNMSTLDELRELITITSVTDTGEPTNALQEIIQAHVGNTPFAAALILELYEGLKEDDDNDDDDITIAKPDNFDEIESMNTLTEIEDIMQTISQKSLYEMFLYAITDNEDHAMMASVLTQYIQEPIASELQTLVNLIMNDKYNKKNLSFITTNDIACEQLKKVLSMA